MATVPHLLSEDTGNPPFTGCTWVTAVMMAAYGGIHLPMGITTDEHYALVKQAGLVVGHEGATLSDVQRGYQHRYGVQAHLFHGSITQLYALGDVYALVQGRYSSLPIHYRRWDQSFMGIHAAGYIPKLNWWQDPLATQRFIDAGYNGETISLSALSTYALGFGGIVHALYLKADEFASGGGPAQPTGGDMIYSRGGLVTALVKAGTPYADHAAGPTIATFLVDTRVLCVAFDQGGQWVAVDGTYSHPQTPTTVRLGWITTGGLTDVQPFNSTDCTAAVAADRAKAYIAWKP